jgi:hypothetical protein
MTDDDIVVLRGLLGAANSTITTLAQANRRLTDRIASLEAEVEARNAVLNYWYPRLGYATANELVYPAVGDRRAQPAPRLLEE